MADMFRHHHQLSSSFRKKMAKLTQLLTACLAFGGISATFAQLPSSEVAQKPCLSPLPTTTPALDTLWFFTHPLEPYYVSNGSQHLYRSYAEVFLGRPADDEAELDAMDLQLYFEPSYSVFTIGYGKTLAQQCLPNLGKTVLDTLQGLLGTIASLLYSPFLLKGLLGGLGLNGLTEAHCVPWPVALDFPSPLPPAIDINNGVSTNLILSSDDRIVWQSKSEGAVLVTRCVNNEIADWKVLSLKRTVSPAASAAINQKIVQLGLEL